MAWRYDEVMAVVVNISEEEAARDVKALFERVREGEKIRVERHGCPDVMIVSDEPVKAGSVGAIIDEPKQREETHGLVVHDEGLAVDVAEARKRYSSPKDHPAWERRTIAEAREILRLRREARGLAIPDPGFASDMEAIHDA